MKKTAFSLFLTAILAGLAPGPALADSASRLNVVAHALASYENPEIKTLAVTGFTSLQGGQRPPFSGMIEEKLRQALKRQKGPYQILDASRNPQDADALLTGTFSREGDLVRIHAVLSDESGTALWSRDCLLEASEFKDSDFGRAAAAPASPIQQPGNAEVIPSLPAYGYGNPYSTAYPRRNGGPQHLDLEMGYRAFFPLNSTLQSVAGRQFNGYRLGLTFDDIFRMDYDYWSQSVAGQGTITGLEYFGTQFALTYPWRLGPAIVVYLGPGGRFGQIRVNDSSVPVDSVLFGNNGFIGMAGAKAMLGPIGLDLRYTYDLAYTYTGYHTLSLGAVYEFGM